MNEPAPSSESEPSLVRAEIDLSALQANAARLAELVAPARLKCIVKSNAYGHGVEAVTRALAEAGFTEFGVATIAEALHLRDLLGDDVSIMAWLYGSHTNLDRAIEERIDIGVSTVDALQRIHRSARHLGVNAHIHLKIDSGLGRNGFTPDGFDQALGWLGRLTDADVNTHLTVSGVMSHFAVADEPERTETAAQSAVFESWRERLESVLIEADGRLGAVEHLEVHIANSPAALTLKPVPGNAARVGLALYGLSPLEDREAADLGLVPVMRLVSQVVNLKNIPAGHGASYGLSFVASRDTRFALVPGGYGDGIPRSASNRAEVSIRGRRYPVVGRIAMDQMIVDVGADDGLEPGASDVAIGDEVVIFGPGGPSAAEWGAWADTINYEIVTRISDRVDRVPVQGALEHSEQVAP